MKKIIGFISALLCMSGLAFADLDMVKISIKDVATNTTAVATSRSTQANVSGLIEYVFVDLSGAASPDIDIDIKTVGGTGAGASRTLWGDDDVTADVTALLREVAEDSAAGTTGIVNQSGKIPVMNDTIQVDAYDANKALINVDIYIFYTR